MSDLIERLERLAALDTKLGNRTDDPRNRVVMMEEAAARIRVLEEALKALHEASIADQRARNKKPPSGPLYERVEEVLRQMSENAARLNKSPRGDA